MDHLPPSELHQEAPPVPPEWIKPPAIGSEGDSGGPPSSDSYMDAPTGVLGSEDETVAVELETPKEPAAHTEDEPTPLAASNVAGGLGNASLAVTVDTTGAGKGEHDDTKKSSEDHPNDAQADEPPTPAAADVPADIPPEIPPASGETEPNRGEALRTVLQHAADSSTRFHERLRGIIIDNAEAVGLGEHLEDEDFGMGLDESVDYLAGTKQLNGQNIRDRALTDELIEAQNTYENTLTDAGVQFSPRNARELALEITDPQAYTEALEQLQAAGITPREREEFPWQLEMIFERALYKAAETIIGNNQPEALTACNGAIPDYDEFIGPPGEQDTSAESLTFADKLAANASRLAPVLTAMGAAENTVAPVRQLGIAHAAGLTVEWAVGLSIDVIGQSGLTMGVDRLTNPEQWEPVYGYLTHLQATAPTEPFTEEIRSMLLGDLYAAAFTPLEENWLGEVYADPEAYTAMLSDRIERIIALMPRE